MERSLATFRKLTAAIPAKGRVSLSYPAKSIALIKLDSLPTRNALTPSMMNDLAEIARTLTASPPNYLVLTGANGTFCSGADIGVAKDTLMTSSGGSAMANLMNNVTGAISSLPTVSFCSIDGAAFGGGAELSTSTDFRCMRRDAKLRFVQTTMGVTTGWGGGRRLAEIVGEREALRLLLLSEAVDADTAVRLGLADFVVEEDGLSSGDFTLDLIERLKTPDALVHSLKSVVGAKSAEEEIREFEKHWGADPHALAFNRAIAKAKKP